MYSHRSFTLIDEKIKGKIYNICFIYLEYVYMKLSYKYSKGQRHGYTIGKFYGCGGNLCFLYKICY